MTVRRSTARPRGPHARCLARRLAAPAAISLLAAMLATRDAGAQRPTGTQLEWRLDAIGASTSSLQGGVGVNIPAGLYVRVGATVAGGVAAHDGVRTGAARADVTARFLLDPYRESPKGLYGVGGLSTMYDPIDGWRPRVLVGAGIDFRPRARHHVAAELALGGGVRVSIVVRRARLRGR